MIELKGIIRELEQQRAQIDVALKLLHSLRAKSTRGARRGRRTLSAAARRRIAVAQRARWAKWKGGKK
jgi:hypothetical protein